jgi:hypothetical protein
VREEEEGLRERKRVLDPENLWKTPNEKDAQKAG